MYAVVIARRQIGGGEQAVAERLGQQIVAGQQRFQTVMVAFSLEDLIVADRTELADGAVGGQRQPVGVGDDRARAVSSGRTKKSLKVA